MPGFPTSHTVISVSGSSTGSGSLPKHGADVDWSNPHIPGQTRWNQGQSNSLTDHAAGTGLGPGSGENTLWSEMGIFEFAWTTEGSRHSAGESAPSSPPRGCRLY